MTEIPMEELQQKIAEMQKAIDADTQELAILREKIPTLRIELQAMERRMVELGGGTFARDRGSLVYAKERLAGLELEYKDRQVRPVRVIRSWGNHEMVLRRVTAKCIFLSSVGSDREVRFSKDGSTTWGESIHPEDLAAILDGTIKESRIAK